MRILWFLPLVLGLISFTPERPDDQSVIRIGMTASMTGVLQSFGEESTNGAQLAVDEINKNGGILGRRVELIVQDTRSMSQDAAAATRHLIESGDVQAIIGDVASSLVIASAPIVDREKIALVTPAGTNPKITVEDGGKVRNYVFRACFEDPYQGEAMAQFARDGLYAKKAAILTDRATDYSVGLVRAFREKFTALGGSIVSEQSYEAGQVNFHDQLTAILESKPDVLYLPGYYTEVSLIAIESAVSWVDNSAHWWRWMGQPTIVERQCRKCISPAY